MAGDAGDGGVHAQFLLARVEQMLISQTSFEVLPIKGNICLARTVEVLEIVHPGQRHFEISCQDVLGRSLELDVDAGILAAGAFGSVDQLVHPGPCSHNLPMQLALNQVFFVLPIVVEAHAPSALVKVQCHIPVQKAVEAVVERCHCAEHIGRLLLGNDVDNASGTFRIIFHIRAGHNLDALHIGRRNALQTAQRSGNSVYQDEHVAVAPNGNASVSIDTNGRCSADYFKHGARCRSCA